MVLMDKRQVEDALHAVLEELASIEHERWSHWQRYMHGAGDKKEDGSIVLSPHLVERWERQYDTAYSDLSESEKESDREQVRKYLPSIVQALTGS
jgi:hypothetical protein